MAIPFHGTSISQARDISKYFLIDYIYINEMTDHSMASFWFAILMQGSEWTIFVHGSFYFFDGPVTRFEQTKPECVVIRPTSMARLLRNGSTNFYTVADLISIRTS